YSAYDFILTVLPKFYVSNVFVVRRYRDKKQRRVLVGEEQTRPLLRENGDRRDMEENMHKLSETVGKIRSEIEQSSARNGINFYNMYTMILNFLSVNLRIIARGDFEDGYVRGFRDANKLGSASAARGFMHDEYGSRDDRFHEGYVKGLRDAGMTGMSTSMRNLCRDREPGGYSSGYMQGFRDGNSGVYGDRMSTNLLRRLDEQYPNQDEFHAGYIDGFKEGTSSRTSEHRKFEETRRLQESLTKLTEILQDKTKGGGDEIHTTKIYHVYNQTPEALSTAYSTTSAKHLEHELEELTSSSSRRNTLRKHYTPGDYLKYGSETDGYGSLGRNRRSLSVSALGRGNATITLCSQITFSVVFYFLFVSYEEMLNSVNIFNKSKRLKRFAFDVYRDTAFLSAQFFYLDTNVDNSRYQTGTGTSYISRSSAAERSTTDTFSRRYNYRSRSDMESPRRYASQTLLDGARPGPSTPHARRDALNTLQRELDTLSRSPDRSTPHGYSSDTGYVNESMRNESSMRNDSSMRSRTRGYSNYDYDSYQTTRSEVKTTSPLTPTNGTRSIRYPVSVPVRQGASSSYSYRKESGTSGVEAGPSSHNWPNDLTDIVNEPMGQTLERMKKYSSSVSQMDHEGVSSGMGDDGIKESIEERYQRSYKEEYTTGP
uniref:t-SNARE coiled-coil homology domain-containing protein n=1 Tax=Syphacia muris TaxID=451379 RepID=A0A158R407_9BILA